MSNALSNCRLCGRPAPVIEGWSEDLPGYRLVRSPWPGGGPFFDGPLHFSCLRRSPERLSFSREFSDMVRAGTEVIEIEINGNMEELTRTGLAYSDEVYSGTSCSIYKSPVADQWIITEHDGPWYAVGLEQLRKIQSGQTIYSPGGESRYILPRAPEESPEKWNLPEFLYFLEVDDLYDRLAETPGIEFRVFKYYQPKQLLSYSVKSPIPLPEEAIAALRMYAATYSPVQLSDDGDEPSA